MHATLSAIPRDYLTIAAVCFIIIMFVILYACINSAADIAMFNNARIDNGIVNTAIAETTAAYAERLELGYSKRAARSYIRAILYRKYAFTPEIINDVMNKVLFAHYKGV